MDDVDTTGVTDGQIITWNDTAGEWVVEDIEAGLWEIDGSETQLIDADGIDMQSEDILNVEDITLDQDIIFLTSNDIRADTSDASDNQYLRISGGGAALQSRGAFLVLGGNEEATYDGDAWLYSGYDGNIYLISGSGGGNDIFMNSGQMKLEGSTGYVGIGTNDPVADLHILGATNDADKFWLDCSGFDPDYDASGDFIAYMNAYQIDGLFIQAGWDYQDYDILRCAALDTGYVEVPRFEVESDGDVWIDQRLGIGVNEPDMSLEIAFLTGTTSGAYMRWNSVSDAVYYYSSSERYKSDINPFTDDWYKILELEPKIFKDCIAEEAGVESKDCFGIGFLAEDADALGLTALVGYREDIEGREGERLPDTLEYQLITLYLQQIIKDQQATIEAQEERIKLLEEDIQAIKDHLGL